MNQIKIGKFIQRKRKEMNLTQEQLAEKLGISSKTISKWETGKSMPDYSIVQALCEILVIDISELMDGQEKAEGGSFSYNEDQILDLLRRTQELENQKNMIYGMLLIVLGVALQSLSYNLGGSSAKDFLGGLMLGLSIVSLLAGVYSLGTSLKK